VPIAQKRNIMPKAFNVPIPLLLFLFKEGANIGIISVKKANTGTRNGKIFEISISSATPLLNLYTMNRHHSGSNGVIFLHI
jgi:hypothetical protein